MSAGRLTLQVEELDMAELLHDLTARCQLDAQKARCDLQLRTDGHIHGRWDRMRIEQLVTNLLSNAFKYGSGKPVQLEARLRDGLVRLSVTDHGIGIDPRSLDDIFDRFARAVSARHY